MGVVDGAAAFPTRSLFTHGGLTSPFRRLPGSTSPSTPRDHDSQHAGCVWWTISIETRMTGGNGNTPMSACLPACLHSRVDLFLAVWYSFFFRHCPQTVLACVPVICLLIQQPELLEDVAPLLAQMVTVPGCKLVVAGVRALCRGEEAASRLHRICRNNPSCASYHNMFVCAGVVTLVCQGICKPRTNLDVHIDCALRHSPDECWQVCAVWDGIIAPVSTCVPHGSVFAVCCDVVSFVVLVCFVLYVAIHPWLYNLQQYRESREKR